MKTIEEKIIFPTGLEVSTEIVERLKSFFTQFKPYENQSGTKLCLYFDQRSQAYYVTCHLEGSILSLSCDLEASLEGSNEDDEIYKLNREITEDQSAFKGMLKDAAGGRSFEDIVLEYDLSYSPKLPLKVYGGQHRLSAITRTKDISGNTLHGVRIYFCLSRDQKVEIATVNNTAIAIPNDLLDRMQEHLLGPEMRDWCHKVGLLEAGEDFSDRKSPNIPTSRLARTLLVNFYKGQEAKDVNDFHQPVLCSSGNVSDERYLKLREKIDWADKNLVDMGEEFARLHKIQRQTVTEREEDTKAEFARKALSLAVIASWSYAAGLFQRNQEYLKILYSIPDNVTFPDDPLNAKELSMARLKGVDSDTYRGLGARSNADELGRMLEVFLVLVTQAKIKRINKKLANIAIQSYVAKKASNEVEKAFKKI